MDTINETNFTPAELHLLRLAFKLVDDVVEMHGKNNYIDMRNDLYNLEEKLGVYDLLDQ